MNEGEMDHKEQDEFDLEPSTEGEDKLSQRNHVSLVDFNSIKHCHCTHSGHILFILQTKNPGLTNTVN
jgi:hypothetical protein